MNDPIFIRYAGREELGSVAGFLHDCWREAYRPIVAEHDLNALSVEQRHNGLLARYDEGACEILMMYAGSQLIGAAVFGKSFTEGYAEDGEITALYLRGDSVGKGCGRRLFAEAERALAAKGYAHFVLDVLADNTRAFRFYLARGYEKVDDRLIRLGKNEYPMAVLRKKSPLSEDVAAATKTPGS